jgi:hypothetical protein
MLYPLMKAGVPFALALTVGCALTVTLYLALVWGGPRLGLRL